MLALATSKTYERATRPPRGPWVLNRDAALAQDLDFAFVATPTGRLVDLVTMQSWAWPQGGLACAFESVGGRVIDDGASNNGVDTGLTGRRGDELTMATWFDYRYTASSAGSKYLAAHTPVGSATIGIALGQYSSNNQYRGLVACGTNAGGRSLNFSSSVPYRFQDRMQSMQLISASCTPQDIWGYLCGEYMGNNNTPSSTSIAWAASGGRWHIGQLYDAAQSFDGAIFAALVYHRTKEDLWHWQLYDPATRWNWLYRTGLRSYFIPAAGGTTKSVADTAAGADAIAQLAVSLGVTDTGAGADAAPGAAAALALADAAAGADLIAALAAEFGITDAGAGSDALSVIMDTLLSVTDAGSGADVIGALSAALGVADTGVGADAIAGISVSLSVADAGAGADALANISALLALAESATGTDALSVLQEILITIADAGAGADGLAIEVVAQLTDNATGLDALGALAALVALADAGAGVDVVLRFDAAVRIVKAVFTLRARAAVFALASRAMSFGLATRSMTFQLAA